MGKNLAKLMANTRDDRDPYAYLREVETGSDRSVALLLGADAEKCLARYMLVKLDITDPAISEKLTGRGGPLGTFHQCAMLAEATGAITSAEAQAVKVVRDVRNAFAHAARPVTFDTPEIVAECDPLRKITKLSKKAPTRKVYVDAARIIILTCHIRGMQILTDRFTAYMAKNPKMVA